MTIASASRVKLAYVAESSWGATKTGSNLQVLRALGESLKQGGASIESAQIDSTRMRTGVRRSSVDAGGDVNAELSYGTFDDWFLGALFASAWSSPVTVSASTISAASGDNSYNDSGSGFGSILANQWIYVTGFTTAANNGWSKVATSEAGKLVVTGKTLVSEDAGDAVVLTMPAYATTGTTMTSYNIERTYTDLSNDLALFKGMTINQMALTVPTEGNITVTFSFMGSVETSATSSAGSGYTAATTTEPMTSLDVTALLEGGTSLTVNGFSLTLTNGLRNRRVCGSSAVYSMGDGPIGLTGTLQAYYSGSTLYDKFLNDTATDLALQLADQAGNRYLLDIPQVKFTPGGQGREASNNTSDIVPNLNWSAYKDPTEAVMFRIVKLAA